MGIREKIKKIQALEKRGVDNPDYRNILLKNWEERALQTELDLEIWHRFCENAEKGSIENNNRFRLKYVFDLNLDWKILILLGKKNIGKTYEFVKLINRLCAEGDGEVVLLRMQAKEIVTGLYPLLNYDSKSNIRIQQKSNSYYELVHKTRKDARDKPKRCGFAASINSLTSYQGASYDNVKYVIWDECISDDGNLKITQNDLNTFERFLSSVVRDKTDVKVLIFGNLLKKVSNVAGDAVLNHFGIPIEANCKYIQASSGAKVLFLNTRNMFTGIESQKILAGVDQATQQSLLDNTINPRGIKTVGKYEFLDAIPNFALLFVYNKIKYIIHIAIPKNPDPNDKEYWIMNLEIFTDNSLYDYEVYTDDPTIYNNYSNHVLYTKESRFLRKWKSIIKMIKGSQMLYSDDYTAEQSNIYVKHFETKILNEEDTVKWKKK